VGRRPATEEAVDEASEILRLNLMPHGENRESSGRCQQLEYRRLPRARWRWAGEKKPDLIDVKLVSRR
jgi:hypothetical protein